MSSAYEYRVFRVSKGFLTPLVKGEISPLKFFPSRLEILAKTAANQVDFQGIPVTIEDAKGSVRKGTDPTGKAWEKEMRCDYGSIPGTSGAGDGERVDVYLGEDEAAAFAYVVEQVGPTGQFDEYKLMLGFPDLESAREMYEYQGPNDWDGLGEIYEVPMQELYTAVAEHRKTASSAELCAKFIALYENQRPIYEKAADVIRLELIKVCDALGLRAAVTSRAKSVSSLAGKLEKRSAIRPYTSLPEIFADIKDLAGVRVALYFPIDRQPLGEAILDLWSQGRPPKQFPEEREPGEPEGYEATHFTIKYAGLLVEVQVATALMYAWAEVAHDLIYKPRLGQLKADEYQLLDDLKQIVEAGEHTVALLQNSLSVRVACQRKNSAKVRVGWMRILAARERYLSN